MATEQTYSQSMSDEQVKAIVEARVQAAIDEGSKRPVQQIAEPAGWLNIWALGPFQVIEVTTPPLLPHKVIRVGEDFYVATVIWLNPNFIILPGTNACASLSGLGTKFRIDYCTVDMCAVRPVPQFSPHGILVDTVPNQCFYVNVQHFKASSTEMISCVYEMNICFQMMSYMNTATDVAGWVTEVYDFDPDLFYPSRPPLPPPTPPFPPGAPAGWRFNAPIRFQIYG